MGASEQRLQGGSTRTFGHVPVHTAFKNVLPPYLLLESEDFQAADCPSLCRWLAALEDPHETLAGDLGDGCLNQLSGKSLWGGFQCQPHNEGRMDGECGEPRGAQMKRAADSGPLQRD